MNKQISYSLTDEEILSHKSSPAKPSNLDQYIRKKDNGPLFQRFFINSIFSVKEPSSQYQLVFYLKQRFEGVFCFPILEIQQLYQVLFNNLPKNENFQRNIEYKDLLFRCMNYFMLKFYNSTYPYFYDLDNDESLFSYDRNFIIDYLHSFSYISRYCLKQHLPYNDESITNILNYLFELLLDGIEYNKVSKIIDNLFSAIDFNFMLNYIAKKNFLSKSSTIYVNNKKKSIFLMTYKITFYEKHISEIVEKHNEEIFSNLFEFIKKILFIYTERLISEGRLINIQNPFKYDQINIQLDSYKFYPEKVDDTEILNLLYITFNKSFDDKIKDDYYQIFLPIFKLIPGLITIDHSRPAEILFNYFQMSDSKNFDLLKSIFFEAIQDRIIGNYKFNFGPIMHFFNTDQEDKNQSSMIFSYIKVLLEFISPSEFFEKLQYNDIEDSFKLFNIIIRNKNYMHINIVPDLLFHYKEYATRPEIVSKYIKALIDQNQRFDSNFREIIEKIMLFIINDPKITEKVDSSLLIPFFERNKHINCDVSSFESSLHNFIENFDSFKVQLIFILLSDNDSEIFNEYLNKSCQCLCDKLLKLEVLDEKVFQFIITFSPFLSTFKIGDRRIVDKIKSCISYANEKQEVNVINCNHSEEKVFDNSAFKANFYLICFLTKNFGFDIHEEYLSFISKFMNKYGMCIEVLFVISRIIELLIPFIDNQKITNEELLKTNKIFEFVQILIDNSIQLDNKNSDDSDNDSFESNYRLFGQCKKKASLIQFHFSLSNNKIKSEYGDKNNSFSYSYKMKGESIDDKFGYLIKFDDNLERKSSSKLYTKIAKSFIKNISGYATAMISKFGEEIPFIGIFKKTISFSQENQF